MSQVKSGEARAWLLGTVAIASAGPAFAQADAPRLGDPSPEPAIGRQTERPAEGPGAFDGRLAQPGGTTRDETLDLPGALGALTSNAGRPSGADRGVTVARRSGPDSDPIGLRLGAYTLQASATTALGYDSNVFRQNDGASDLYGSLRAAAYLRSTYTRHAVELDAFAEQRVYGSYGTENALTYGANASGRFDVNGRDSVTANVTREHRIIERGAVGEVLRTQRPIRYDFTGSGLSGRKIFGPLIVELSGLISSYDYQDARSPAGPLLDQDFRDFALYEGRADFAYARGGAVSLFASAAAEARRFRNDSPPINRDSNLFEVLGGVRGEITPLIRGQLGLGLIYVDFRDPSLDSKAGLGINVGLEYLVTPLTTIQLSGRRRLQNVGSITSPASLTTEVRLGADHELLRNLILSAGAGFQNADFAGDGVDDRGPRRRYSLDFGGRYLVNRRIRLNADVDYQQRDGGGGLIGNFERLRATASITLSL